MIAGLITNGYLLSPKRIEALNEAGLDYLQISIDNVEPDEVSKKSLRAARRQAEVAGRARSLRRQHQFSRRRRHQEPRGCADDQYAGAAAGLLDVDRHHSRRIRPPEAARGTRTGGVRQRDEPDQRDVARSSRTCTPASETSRRILQTASRTRGTAGLAPATCTSARTVSCTGARSSAALPASRCRRTPSRTSATSSCRPSGARRFARSAASIACRGWTSGASRSGTDSPDTRVGERSVPEPS